VYSVLKTEWENGCVIQIVGIL